MKILTAIGIASLLANAVLLIVIVSGALKSEAPSAGLPTATAAAAAPNSATPAAQEIWSHLQSEDLAAERDRLKEEGFPPSVIRAILAAQIRERSATRRKAIEAASQEQPYWKNPIPDPQAQAQLRALAREEQKALRDLLGSDPFNSHAARLRRDFPELSDEKVDQVAVIRERYDELRQDVQGTTRGSLTPSEREKMNALEKSMQQEIAAVLTPVEAENYELRLSNTANQLRYSLSSFKATEAEFRALFRLQSAFDQDYRYVGSETQEQQRARSEAQKKLNDDIALALGPARYADYQRSNDYSFRQTTQLVSRLNLPPETTLQLHSLQKEFEEKRTALFRDAPPTPQQRDAQLTELANEASARINTILGGNTTATTAYKQYGGSWLTNLTPRPATPPGKK